MEIEKQMFGKQMFAGPAETMGHRMDSNLYLGPAQFPPSFSLHMSDDSTILQTGPLPKFFFFLIEV